MEKRRKRSQKSGDLRLKERLCGALDIAPNAFPNTGSIELRGRSSLCIRDGGRILEYTPERIAVKLPKGSIAVMGRGLCCTTYHKGSVRVDGKIDTLSFLED